MADLWKFLEILAIPVVAGLLWWVDRVRREASEALTKTKAEAMAAVAVVEKKIADNSNTLWREQEQLRSDFHRFEVKVASEYVHVDRLKEVENRILSAITRLENKIDRISEMEARP